MNPSLKNLIRPHYHTLNGYVSAGMEVTKSGDKIFLNANENPYELPQKLTGVQGFNRYPEPQPAALANAYANTYNVQPDQIVMTRGADEAIQILTKIFCEPHQDSVLICPPTFGMYGVNAHAMPANLTEISLIKANGTFKLNTNAIIKACYNPQNRIKLVYICAPNNPTGTSIPHDEIANLCTELDGQSIVILDETYAEFSALGSMAAQLKSLPNLIILRTLSKSYSMAGMRMGCFLNGNPEFINMVKSKALDAYPLPHASVTAALHVLSDNIRAIAQDNIKKIISERKRMELALEKPAIITHIYPSDANFLLIEMQNASAFIAHAAKQNIILRDFSTKPATKNCIRISIGTPEQNDMVLKLFETFE